jgi:ATP-dependent RNA helicase DOB1
MTVVNACAYIQLNAEISAARKDLKRAQTIMQMDELKCRKRVLRR